MVHKHTQHEIRSITPIENSTKMSFREQLRPCCSYIQLQWRQTAALLATRRPLDRTDIDYTEVDIYENKSREFIS